jgi:hypothetical protein
VYLRFVPTSPEDAVAHVLPLLANEGESVNGFFVVMDRDGYRRRPLPGADG